jgi:hypothetical protein
MRALRRQTLLLAAALALLLAILLACVVGGYAVRSSAIPPPEVSLTVGGVGVVAHTTNVPSCVAWFVSCALQPLGPGGRMYAVWLVWDPAPAQPRQGQQPLNPGARRLFAMRIVP